MQADAFDDEPTRVFVPRTTLPELTIVLGAIALVWSCGVAGFAGVALGRTSPLRDREHAVLAKAREAREPRVALVMAAHEAITEPPLMAPSKQEEPVDAPPLRVPAARPTPLATRCGAPAPAPEPRRPGFQRPRTLGRR